jgi:glycosyltransferase involved in cell wall biosynthesis
MKTAIVCGAGFVSGKEIMALELGEGLGEKGLPAIYVTSLWGDGDFCARLRSKGLRFVRMRLGFISATLTVDCLRMTADQMLRWPRLLYDYHRFLNRERPSNVIHTNWHHILVLWPYLKPERDMFWVHDFVPNKTQYVRFYSAMSRRVGVFVTVSESVAGSLRQIGISEAKILVIHNGISDPSANVVVGPRERLQPRIGIVGQVGPWKGHEDLFEAFAAISAHFPGVETHIFGNTESEFAYHLKRLAKALGIADRLVWRGYVSDRSHIYSTIDLCVVPSRLEDPLPTAAIEASFFGLPVVATRKGGLPEIVVDGLTGYLVDSGNSKQLAMRLAELLQDHELRNKMGAAARQRALQKFSRARFIDDFLRLLNPNLSISGEFSCQGTCPGGSRPLA